MTPHELEEINAVARTSGNDVILDALLLRLHTESACRRGGALALRLVDLDRANGLVRLTEKDTVRWQPISLDLAEHLYEHAAERGALLTTDRLLRCRNGQPISSRRYDIRELAGTVDAGADGTVIVTVMTQGRARQVQISRRALLQAGPGR